MDFDMSPEQVELQRMVRDFARNEIAKAQEQMDRDHDFPYDCWRQWCELGMGGIMLPEEYGGSDLDSLSYIIAMEEVATVSQTFALIWQVHILVSNMYKLLGTEQQKREWLPRFASGEILGAFCLTEPGAGSDAGGIATKAERRDGQWILNGNKIFISNAGTKISDGLVVMAVTGVRESGRKALSCFIVPRDAPGFELGQSFTKMAWHGMDNRELVFSDCRIPEANLLGAEGAGLRQALGALNLGRIVFGALGASLVRACLEESLTYAKDRRQFGQPISSFQLIQAKLADMATHAEAVRRFTHYVAWMHSQGMDCHTEAAMVKTMGSELATRAALDAFQIHGGYGFMHEFKVNRLFRESKMLEIGEGTNEVQRLLIARALGC
ncbi:acyl-CoA dehydrogenase family protein [Azospirillum sp.]|uniref:acyl-CoA dehydrogenase family protein n=1 Tax=Azospirillum sp. TaxID=34012 RepID=UPI003D745A09